MFADVRDVYVASVASTSIYNADTNPDGSKVNSSVKTDASSAAVNLVSDTVGGTPKTYSSGESTDGFDTGSMTLVKAHEMVFEDTNGTTILAKDAAGAFVTEGGQVKEFANTDAVSTYATENSITLTAATASKLVTYQDSIGEELDVYEVKKGDEVDTVAGIEQLEFSDTIIDLKAESIKKVSFDVTTGLTEINKTSGTAFGDQIESTAVDEIFSGGDGADVFEFIAGTGTDRITDFIAGVDKLDVLSGVNGTSIATEAGVLARITDTSEGALLDLGNDGSGDLQSVLLIGVSKEDLTSADFLISHL